MVVFSLPLDGEREVPPTTVFQVQFSKDMDEASFKDHVLLRYAGRPQPGDRELDAVRVSYDAGLRTLQIDPGDLLRPGRVVEVVLLPGIVDIDGLPLETRPGFNPGAATDVLRFQMAPPGSRSVQYDGVQEALGCGRAYVSRWRGRFLEHGIAGMYARHKGRKPTAMTPRMHARILARTQGKPDGRLDPLEHSQACRGAWGEPHAGPTSLEPGFDQAASDQELHDLGRSGL